MPPTLRASLTDIAAGIGGLLVCALSFALQPVSMAAVERLIFIAPAVIFPLVTALRVRRSPNRVMTFALVNVSCVIAYVGLELLTHSRFVPFAGPLFAALFASAIAAAVPRWSFAPALLAGTAIALLAPAIWTAILTREVHFAAPDVAVQLRDGSRVRLSDLRGRVVILNFWGTWCGPCVRELPELNTASHHVPQARFFAVNSGIGGEDAATIRRFLTTHRVDVPVAFDFDKTTYHAFGIHGLPTTAVIDPHGVVRKLRVGFASTAHFDDWVEATVAEVSRS